MKLLASLLTTDVGLMSTAVIVFMVAMGIYLRVHIRKLMNQEPGKTGWK